MGSLPRVQGKGLARDLLRVLVRITPACAGKRGYFAVFDSPYKDHPRVCGEKPLVAIWYIVTEGSPPRVRGKAVRSLLLRCRDRITPACAGKRIDSGCGHCLPRDHPRVCGEKCVAGLRRGLIRGSPSRVRGKGRRAKGTPRPPGITPACAGKRRIRGMRSTADKDHPRVCGEKISPSAPEVLSAGSPPRVRGKARRFSPSRRSRRITPACAGKSGWPVVGLKCSRDHPRVCGEKCAGTISTRSAWGSPPRVRGKELFVRRPLHALGITPACAGKRRATLTCK